MPKIYKPGKVALVLSGRFAGRKVIVIRQSDEGTKERPYPHAIVAGIERYPRKVTRGMGKKRIEKRSKVKPFIKTTRPHNPTHGQPTRVLSSLWLKSLITSVRLPLQSINYNHLLPTRYALELEGLKGSVAPETFKEPTHRQEAKKQIKKILEERYIAGKNKWFFTPLRF
ncbi:large subunit ribosomal protein L27e, partial [Phenoliferia sp. Uapishka_3]